MKMRNSLDAENLLNDRSIDWQRFSGKNVFITGGTGLIGSAVVRAFLYADKALGLGMKLFVLARNAEKAEKLFGSELSDNSRLELVMGDVLSLPEIEQPIDYVIHAAAPTASRFFIDHPAETLTTMFLGTKNALDLAAAKKAEGFLFLSTMEVYGYPEKGHKVNENDIGAFKPSDARNSYPVSKIASESLVCAYASEHKLNAMVLRLTQTFGTGVEYDDKRIFAEFARCAIEKRDIVLKTEGKTERSYLYINDAVSAVISVLLKGTGGEIYTAANEETYCSIREMAELVASGYQINVRIELEDITKFGYANTLYMDLDTSKLRSLGWNPSVGLKEMFDILIEDMKCHKM